MTLLLLVLLAGTALGDVSKLASAKAKALHRLLRKPHHHLHHHKRSVYHGLPTFKLGYDIPVVSHSVVKPLVVHYPTKPVPIGVKIPLHNPYELHHHGVRLQRPILLAGTHKDLPHEHHIHHHHVAVKPVVPAAPVPTTSLVPAPSISVPAPAVPLPPPAIPFRPVVPLAPAVVRPLPPPVHLDPAPVLLHPAPAHLHPAPAPPLLPVAPVLRPAFVAPAPLWQIRPGNAVQTSVFAQYPRYQLVAPAPHLLVPRPYALPQPLPVNQPLPVPQPLPAPQPLPVPHGHVSSLIPAASGVLPGVVQPHHDIFLQQPQPDGWNPITTSATNPTVATVVPSQITPAHGYPHHISSQHYTDGQHHVYEHTQEHFDHQHNLQQLEKHIQQQQFDQHQQQFEHQQHQFEQQQQQFEHQQQLEQPQEQYGIPQQQLSIDYGAPQGLSNYQRHDQEGRSFEDNTKEEVEEQKYHNHIPLGLQLPLKRPLEDFH